MNIQGLTWFLTIILIFLQHSLVASPSPIHLSPNMQKFALFQFKQTLTISGPTYCFYDFYHYSYGDYTISSHPKTMNWSMSSNYCTWEGVTCEHKTGNVIGLDLSCSQLRGAILPNSTLFQLSHLQFLNLSNNNFSLSNQFPREFGFFAKGLTHLNLSYTGFSGRVPSGISHLYKLVSLDLNYNYYGPMELEDKVFKSLLQNLTQLRVLNLEEVKISSVLPMNFSSSLRVLNLAGTGLSGRVPSGISHLYKLVSLDLNDNDGAELEDKVFNSLLQNLTQLRVLNLAYVNISSVFPVNFSSSLRVLNLRYTTGLHGVLPQEVFHLPNLEVLDLSYDNHNLTATLPKAKWGSSAGLQYLLLAGIKLHGGLPDSIGCLESLATLDLLGCNLYGPIPKSIGNLSQLTDLGLDYNNFNGPIPAVLANLTNLRGLSVYNNSLTGPLPTRLFDHPSLESLDLHHNNLNGPIPTVLANLTNLRYLDLSNNNFTGPLKLSDTRNMSSSKSQLQSFYCSNNQLSGPIPQSFSQLVNLTGLDLSSNNFSGVLDINMFSRLEYLESLDLSHNSLSVRNISMTILPPKLQILVLSSCNIKEFPHFSGDAENINHLDLSNNQIDGEIPHWIGSVVSYLNLSHNGLTGGLDQLPWNHIQYLDLQHNSLNGSLPTLIYNSSYLEILNLSHNNISGVLPICPTNLSNLMVFDLRMNNIEGNISASLSNFRSLETLNLNGNKLEGRIPSSFAELDFLQVLDLGSNQINDTFPQCLEALPNLQVLVLKSNKFHGVINKSSKKHPFPKLRIIDLSYNEFSGPLPAMYFQNFKAMMIDDVNKMKAAYMGPVLRSNEAVYSDSTSLVIKGVEIELVRILTIFTTIDVSRNNFEGEIPENIGNLVSLRYLNLSHNQYLTGHIPSSIGKLSMLESLDLSSNQLEGEIPQQLASIYTLGRLNLSHNQLSGPIPQGPQFNTFDNDSYVGNLGLCGLPLSKKCDNFNGTQEEENEDGDYFFSGFTWEAVVIGYGCGVVPAFIIGYLMLLARKPKWFAGIIARELGLKIRRMEIRMKF